MADEKKPIRLTIYHQTYSLLASGDPAELEQAAKRVDELITSIARTRNLDATRAAVFACLHLADRVNQLESQLNSVQDRSQKLHSLLDRVLENPPAKS